MGPLGAELRRARRWCASRLPVLVIVGALASSACGVAPIGNPGGSGDGDRDGRPRELSGSLPNGTTWKALVPDDWEGTLLLYSHGYLPGSVPGPPAAQVAPDTRTQNALLDRGYALTGSSYSQNGWAVGTAAQDQLDALDATVAAIGEEPTRVLAYGTSMGGLVTGQLAERAADVIDGAVPTCGLMAGGVSLANYQLDGAHAIDQLLAPDTEIDLVGYATAAEANAAASAMTAAVNAGQRTEKGRARVALAAALFHLPRWRPHEPPPAPGNLGGGQQGLYEYLRDTLGFVLTGRFDIETVAGGNPSWNAGVDYRALFEKSGDRWLVSALYREAGLDLGAELDQLTQTASIEADPTALEWQRQASTLSGQLAMPVLSLHTTADNLAPVQYEEEYREEARRTGSQPLLRQAYVARQGHCSFTPAEIVASILALDQRVTSGEWGDLARAHRLDDAARDLRLGDSEFVRFRPREFLGDRDMAAPPPPPDPPPPPTTQPPTTHPPTTQSPGTTTQPSTTQAPGTTQPPTTDPPSTTQPPTTQSPTTTHPHPSTATP